MEAGADVNARDKDELTPLMFAAGSNTPEVLRVLLEAGADVNAKDTNGWTPLIFAARSNTPEVLTALLEAGAKAKAQDNAGSTALAHTRINKKLEDTQALKLLEEKTGR